MARSSTKALLIPAEQRDAVNTALQRHGYGPDNFSIPLNLSGKEVSHYGCSIAMNPVMEGIVTRTIEATTTVEKFSDFETCLAQKSLERSQDKK